MRRIVGRHMVMVLGVVALMTASLPAFAAPAVSASNSACKDYPGLTARMAGCIRDSINEGAGVFFTDFYPFLQDAIAAVMTIAIIVYGIMLSFGMVEKVGRDTFIILIKLAAVIAFCSNSPLILSTVTRAMDGAAGAVVTYAPASGPADNSGSDFSQSICMQNLIAQQQNADPNKPLISPWLGVDCLLDTVIGIHIVPGTPPAVSGDWWNPKLETANNNGMSRSLIYLFFGAMQSSILGLMMAVIGFFFIYGIVMLIIRCFFTYIAGYMGITFLAIISPLIIPMVLFKETKQYFDKFAKMFISFGLQPIIMLVFLIFSLTALDFAVYSGNYSIYYSIAGDASKAATFDLNTYLSVPRKPDGTALTPNDPNAYPPTYPACTDCVGIINADSAKLLENKADNPNAVPKGARDEKGVLNKLLYAKCTEQDIKNDPTLKTKCSFNYPTYLARHTINWKIMEKAHQPAIAPTAIPGQATARIVLSSVFFCLMVVFILNGILQVVPMIVGDLLGDLNQSPAIGGFGFGGKTPMGGGGVKGSIKGMISNPFKGKGAIGQ